MSGLMAEREWESEETEEIRKRAGEEDSEGEEEPVGEAGGEERTGGEEWLEVSLSGEGWRREAADTMGRGVEAVAEVAVFSSGVSGREGSAKAFDDLTSSFSALLKPGMFFASSLCLTLAQLMPPPPPAFTSGVGVPKKSTPDGKLLLGPSPFPLEIGNPNVYCVPQTRGPVKRPSFAEFRSGTIEERVDREGRRDRGWARAGIGRAG
jgi:hypothetical protein